MTNWKRRLFDRIARRCGYVPARWQITGSVEFKRDEQPFVNLELPSGQRVYGWVDNRLPWMKAVHEPPAASAPSSPPDVATLAGVAAETHCLAESSEGFVCTEEPGHDGWHRAEERDGHLYDTWPQEEARVKPAQLVDEPLETDDLPLASTGRVKSTPEMRATRIAMMCDMIDRHLERADEREQHARRQWWPGARSGWLYAASIHADAARQLAKVLESIERGDWDT